MSPELIRTELGLAQQAELESDEQVRKLTELIDKAQAPGAGVSATDCSRLVVASLAVNERLRERTKALQSVVFRNEAQSIHPR